MLSVKRDLPECWRNCVYAASLDIAFANTGVAIFEFCEAEKQWELVYTNVVWTQREAKRRGTYVVDDDLRRIKEMSFEVYQILHHFDVGLILSEFPFSCGQGKNAAHGMGVGKGVVASVAAVLGVPVDNFLPADTKKHLTGDKSASKEKMIIAAAKLYPEEFAQSCFHSGRSKSGYAGFVEHIADAIAAFETAKRTSQFLPLLERNVTKA